ncbi:MAG: hypothetical protein HKP10_05060, partial [Kiritimatiellales bacterium]|nr:hypothetical protein [Kiritimatiellales bacterium]
MKLFDAHNHVQDKRLSADLDAVMQRARSAGVIRMGVKGCCEADWPNVIRISERYDGIAPSFGVHPWFITDRSADWLAALEKLLL